jgi:hypothetical protein
MKHRTQNCLRCDVIHPEEVLVLKRTIRALVERANTLEVELRGALRLLDRVDATSVSTHWGAVAHFLEDRRDLNHKFEQLTKLPIEALGSPVEWPIVVD